MVRVELKDFGYAGHERGHEQSDRLERQAYPFVRQRSAYLTVIGNTPQCGPRQFHLARAFVNRIDEALEKGGWTRGEWKRLYRLRVLWVRRAEGRDARFNVVGNRQTGVTADLMQTIRTERQILELKIGKI